MNKSPHHTKDVLLAGNKPNKFSLRMSVSNFIECSNLPFDCQLNINDC